ncbi:MAG: aerotolerance regulator BatA [Omnitrophica WOR_2 bacterium RIFCSPHIGHO2_02_FULL_50_17]|nr:MAG: aerotolerance regulator BatA [Omnitrophica WOR_2 bacterium RIFCSPHIGHO2_02_FULL_50_17]
MVFKDFGVLFLIPVTLGILYFLRKRRKEAAVRFSSVSLVDSLPVSWKVKFRHVPNVLRGIVLVLFLIALAGPRSVLKEAVHKTEGIDIILAIDSSGSMAAEDFTIGSKRVNRLEIVKNVVEDFIAQRQHDKIGLVTFAALAYTVCPLTTDYAWLTANLRPISLGIIKDGTAVGSAVASSLARLKKSEAKSKIIILLTDGMNNAGEIDPLAAARVAQALGVKIYTIGAGTKGLVPFPVQDFYGRKVYQRVQIDLDEETLQKIAAVTAGKYFRATDTESLRQIYREIDALEKTEIEEHGYFEYEELFDRVLLAALGILLAQILLSQTLFFQVP